MDCVCIIVIGRNTAVRPSIRAQAHGMGDSRIEIQAKGAVREGFHEPISDKTVNPEDGWQRVRCSIRPYLTNTFGPTNGNIINASSR
jgi:hypothetical protein